MAKSIIPEIPALDNVILTEKIIQSASIQHRHNYYSFPKHIHNNIEIYQLIQGECKMDIGNDVISCKCNDFIMILPNVSHSIYLTSKDTCSFKHIHFNPKEFATLSLEKIVGYPMDLLTCWPALIQTCILPNFCYTSSKLPEKICLLIRRNILTRTDMLLLH